MHHRPQTFVFNDQSEVSAAFDILGECGVRATRISIHRWGTGLAVRVLDPIEGVWLERLVDMGATVSSVWSDAQPSGLSVEYVRTSTTWHEPSR